MENDKKRGRKTESFETWLNKSSKVANDHKDKVARKYCLKKLPQAEQSEAKELSTVDLYKRALKVVPMGEPTFLAELKRAFRGARPDTMRVLGRSVPYSTVPVKLPKEELKRIDAYRKRKGIASRSELIIEAFKKLREVDQDLKSHFQKWEKDYEERTQQKLTRLGQEKDNKIKKLREEAESVRNDLARQKGLYERSTELLISEIEMLYIQLGSYEHIFDQNELDYSELRTGDKALSNRAKSEVKHLKGRLRRLSTLSSKDKEESSKHSSNSTNCSE